MLVGEVKGTVCLVACTAYICEKTIAASKRSQEAETKQAGLLQSGDHAVFEKVLLHQREVLKRLSMYPAVRRRRAHMRTTKHTPPPPVCQTLKTCSSASCSMPTL